MPHSTKSNFLKNLLVSITVGPQWSNRRTITIFSTSRWWKHEQIEPPGRLKSLLPGDFWQMKLDLCKFSVDLDTWECLEIDLITLTSHREMWCFFKNKTLSVSEKKLALRKAWANNTLLSSNWNLSPARSITVPWEEPQLDPNFKRGLEFWTHRQSQNYILEGFLMTWVKRLNYFKLSMLTQEKKESHLGFPNSFKEDLIQHTFLQSESFDGWLIFYLIF